ncbi:hypothetical protein B0H39_001307 [Clostridium beijerinckii]|nr:hypothetical protein [Clostridium beijerinckii]NOV70839.1 hypothetical protein [Clostridium beijerinckii]NOW33757.1 hypothetical protein [Clostridium beijerinckii]NOW83426.1 hypothetical protein [Clostridium beijerinckii]
MKWDEVRKTSPNTFVKIQILDSHLDGDVSIVLWTHS